jgi:ABC-2 type transport system permease protein
MTTPLGRGDLIGGYALAFGLAAVVQSSVSTAVAVWLLDLSIYQPWTLLLFAVLDSVLGTAIGLLTSAFAVTEFQAVQFMQVVVMPQILLSGLIASRDSLPGVLGFISDVLPLSYATDAFTEMANVSMFSRDLVKDLIILVVSIEVAVVLASTTLRRRTP